MQINFYLHDIYAYVYGRQFNQKTPTSRFPLYTIVNRRLE